jgi:hypothetical protein
MSAEQQLEQELAEVRQQLAGYNDLKDRERRLEGALAVLNGAAPSVTRSAPSRARRSSNGGSGAIDREQIVAELRRHDQMPATYLADQLELSVKGIPTTTLSRVLKEMTDDGTLTKTGERRATKYSVAKP